MIERRLENLLELDYPPEKLELVVASDGSTDRTDELVAILGEVRPRVGFLSVSRGPARSPRRTRPSATPRARSSRSPTRTRSGGGTRCASSFAASPTRRSRTSAAATSTSRPDGTNREGLYSRYENWLRRSESLLGSLTAGVGPDLCRAPRGLRRARPALRPRPRRSPYLPSCGAAGARSSTRTPSRGSGPRGTSATRTRARSACSSTAG